MKSVPLPSLAGLEAAYARLQWGEDIPPPADLVLWAHWARLDARLAEILVRFFGRSFRLIHPSLLWEENARAALPQALAVLVDFARAEARRRPRGEERRAFENWAGAVIGKLPKASPQMFFVRAGTPKPTRDQAAIERSLRPYLRWGFFGDHSPLSTKTEGRGTMLAPGGRALVLEELRRGGEEFSVKDYIAACKGLVHRRAAERDLERARGLVKRGFTRGTVYRRR